MGLTLDFPTGCYLQCFFHSLAGGEKKKEQFTDTETKLPRTCFQALDPSSTDPKTSFS